MGDNHIDRQLEFIERLSNTEIDTDQFMEQLTLFSHYLASSNEDYRYNETYLTKFCKKFVTFKKYASLKIKLFFKLIDSRPIDLGGWKLAISIDRFWEFRSWSEDALRANPQINHDIICSDYVHIKCYLESQQTRRVFSDSYKVISNSELAEEQVEYLITDFQNWIGGICDE